MYETKRRLSVCWFFLGGFLGLEERCVYLSMVLCVLVFWGGFPWLGGEMCVSIYGVVCVESLFDGESENDRRRAGVNVFASSVYVCVCVCVLCAVDARVG